MNTIKNIGLINCGGIGQTLQLDSTNYLDGKSVKKVLMADKASADRVQLQYPEVEIVEDKNAILYDQAIDLVIVSSPKASDMNMVAEVLQAGKNVQIL